MTNIKDLPEVNFLETDPQYYIDRQVAEYEAITKRKLSQGDPVYLFILSIAAQRAKHAIEINDALKQQLLYYARDGVLDHKGNAWDTPRIGDDKARVTMRFFLEKSRIGVAYVKKGSLVTSNGDVLFETIHDVVARSNDDYIDVHTQCTQGGIIGNGFLEGEIKELIKPIQYVIKCENITKSSGGTEIESNDAYKKRIQRAPEKMTTAGSEGAYEYHTYSVSPLISDVHVHSPQPGHVNISFLLQGGELPDEEMINAVKEKLSSKKLRPLTDYVLIGTPETDEYSLDLIYYISKNSPDIDAVHLKIESAIEEYIKWQSEKIGRDINPSYLTELCMRAGAKRIEILSPVFTVVEDGHSAKLIKKNIIFGGVEDD